MRAAALCPIRVISCFLGRRRWRRYWFPRLGEQSVRRSDASQSSSPADAMSLPEEELTCPVCCDIFSDPVLLSCSHSFCRSCLKRCWETQLRQCPVCRKKTSKSNPPSNLALRNLCEALLLSRRRSLAPPQHDPAGCHLHGEKLKLFCVVDKQPLCVVCQASKLHKGHECLPAEEAALDCKEELSLSLKRLQDKLERLEKIRHTSADTVQHIKDQALQTSTVISRHFQQLQQLLQREESARLAAVREEEERKIAGINERMRELSAEELSLTETIALIQEQLKEDDIVLMKNFKALQDSCTPTAPDDMAGVLIDVNHHLCNLKYKVWEKMLEHVDYRPVTLDPNSAHPCLILSDDLTALHYSRQQSGCPDNPERFHMSAEVVGAAPLGSGSHRWSLETGNNRDWLVGVASASVPRSAEVAARPENGYWTLCFRDGELRAMTTPPTALPVPEIPTQVKVQLDYNKGTLSFKGGDDTLIYEFTHTFEETLLPYFYTQSSEPLKILPEKVLVTMLRQ